MSGPPPDPETDRYVSLATFRRDGREVRTPVWVASIDGRACCFSAGAAGKVKRIRANPRVRVARCDARGRLLGAWREGRAVIIDDARRITAAHAALRCKYGWQMWLADLLARLGGRLERRAYLEISLE